MGPAGDQLLKVLAGAHPDDPVDPPTELQAVYVTTHRLYATWYAARSRGDLYRVEPVGPIERSRTDHFETYTTPAARVLEVLRRGVFLVRRQRRELLREWRRADARVARDRRSFTERAIAAMERELTTG